MPRRQRTWSKVSALSVLVLGFAASVTMNLVSGWLQEDVVTNLLYLFLVMFLLLAISYSFKKVKTPPLLTKVFWFLVISVSLNLFSTWFQTYMLHNKFTASNVTVILALTVIILSVSGLIESHYFRRKGQSIRMKRMYNARTMTPPAFRGEENTVRRRSSRTNRKKR